MSLFWSRVCFENDNQFDMHTFAVRFPRTKALRHSRAPAIDDLPKEEARVNEEGVTGAKGTGCCEISFG